MGFEDRIALSAVLGGLMREWTERLSESGVSWGIRSMKTRWGVCNYVKRKITFAEMLFGQDRALVEYVVVHELTHLKAHDHGPYFKFLMSSRLSDWQERRKRLNGK